MADDSLGLFAYRIFRPIAKKYGDKIFKDVKKDLSKGGMGFTVQEYFALFLLVEIVVLSVFMIAGFIMINILTQDIITSITATLLFSLFISMAIFTFFLLYPSNQVQERSKKIDNALHFATLYMATLSTTGANPLLIFRVLSGFEEFGEISKISRRIVEEVDVYGYDIAESLKKHADEVPNNNLSELLWGVRATIVSGGDLNTFLSEKSETFVRLFKRRLEEFVKTTSLFMEMYITIVIVGTIFMIVLTTIMSIMGGFLSQLQTIQILFVGLGIPFTTTAFVIMLKTISPTEV